MKPLYPRWMMVALGISLTLLTGVLTTAQLLNGLMLYDDPEAIRDGQYFMVFMIGGAAGLVTAIPAAVMVGIFIARNVGFALLLSRVLLVCLAIGMSVGVVLAGLGGGGNALEWAAIGVLLSGLGVPLAPLVLFVLPDTLSVSAPVGGALLLAVLGAYWYYQRTERDHKRDDHAP